MKDCIFCKIVNKEIPSKGAYEDDSVYAFHDINPVAPIHILIVPKKHIFGIQSLEPEDEQLVGHMFYVARKLGEKLNLSSPDSTKDGYRLVFNVGENAGQSVFHLHLHLIGGRSMSWPPG
ncbi:histidine triad nucleotide-binding protein [Thermocrinis sp.]